MNENSHSSSKPSSIMRGVIWIRTLLMMFRVSVKRCVSSTFVFHPPGNSHLTTLGRPSLFVIRSAGDIAYIYSRFCPDIERECARAMGRTDAAPFMEFSDAHWASIANWTQGDRDLGDDEEFDEGDEPLSDDDTDDGDGS